MEVWLKAFEVWLLLHVLDVYIPLDILYTSKFSRPIIFEVKNQAREILEYPILETLHAQKLLPRNVWK